jgi:hypothetical protein
MESPRSLVSRRDEEPIIISLTDSLPVDIDATNDYRVDFRWEFDRLFVVPEVTAAELLPMVTSRVEE